MRTTPLSARIALASKIANAGSFSTVVAHTTCAPEAAATHDWPPSPRVVDGSERLRARCEVVSYLDQRAGAGA